MSNHSSHKSPKSNHRWAKAEGRDCGYCPGDYRNPPMKCCHGRPFREGNGFSTRREENRDVTDIIK